MYLEFCFDFEGIFLLDKNDLMCRNIGCVYVNGFVFSFTTDVDECKMTPCKNGSCLNTFGSFLCTCPPGSKLDITGLTCIGQ